MKIKLVLSNNSVKIALSKQNKPKGIQTMKASAMFATIQDLAKFMAKPQAVQYTTGDAYEQLSSFWIDFTIESFMSVEDMKDRVRSFNGVLIVHYED